MEERRKTTSVRQLEILIDFLEGHRDLALGRVRCKEARAVAERLWNELSEVLNSLGPARTGKQWSKVWNDHKCKVRSKLVAINANQHATGGGPSSAAALSPLEARIANIIGRDVGPMSNVRQDQFASNVQSAAEVEAPSIPEQLDQQSAMNTSPPIIVLQINDEAPGTMPSPTGHTPTTQSPYRTPRNHRSPVQARRVMRRQRRTRLPVDQTSAEPPALSRISALDESRRIVLRIEELRAETHHKIAEAAKLIAESIDRFSRQYCRQSSGDNI
ncbi:hypothetical protein ACJJTC_005801 [Scirpophaga incertulas]